MDDLLRAYPDALAGFDGTDLIWRDGTRMKVDDGRPDKTPEEQLRHGSILDQLRLPYPAGAPVLRAATGSGPRPQQSVLRQDVWRLQGGAGGAEAGARSLAADHLGTRRSA